MARSNSKSLIHEQKCRPYELSYPLMFSCTFFSNSWKCQRLAYVLVYVLVSVLVSLLASVLAFSLAFGLEAHLLLKVCIRSACPACKLDSLLQREQRKPFAKKPKCSRFPETNGGEVSRPTRWKGTNDSLCNRASPGTRRDRVVLQILCRTSLSWRRHLDWKDLVRTPPHR